MLLSVLIIQIIVKHEITMVIILDNLTAARYIIMSCKGHIFSKMEQHPTPHCVQGTLNAARQFLIISSSIGILKFRCPHVNVI
jgi:hypothetical protein